MSDNNNSNIDEVVIDESNIQEILNNVDKNLNEMEETFDAVNNYKPKTKEEISQILENMKRGYEANKDKTDKEEEETILEVILGKPTLSGKCQTLWWVMSVSVCLCCTIVSCNIPCLITNTTTGCCWKRCCLCKCVTKK